MQKYSSKKTFPNGSLFERGWVARVGVRRRVRVGFRGVFANEFAKAFDTNKRLHRQTLFF